MVRLAALRPLRLPVPLPVRLALAAVRLPVLLLVRLAPARLAMGLTVPPMV